MTLLVFVPQVLVIIDVKPKDLGLPTEAYISVEEIHDVRENFEDLKGNPEFKINFMSDMRFNCLLLGWHTNIKDL